MVEHSREALEEVRKYDKNNDNRIKKDILEITKEVKPYHSQFYEIITLFTKIRAKYPDNEFLPGELIEVCLIGVDWYKKDLSGANLHFADLCYAVLFMSNLSNSNLSRTKLLSADLRYANLSGADLDGSDLSVARLVSANLGNTELRCAKFHEAEYNSEFYQMGPPTIFPEWFDPIEKGMIDISKEEEMRKIISKKLEDA